MTGILAGLRPLLIKELREWWRRGAALVTLVVVTALTALGTLATRIDELAGGVPSPAELVPTANVLGSQLDQWAVLAAIFGSIGLVATERASGTLAWTLSQPVSRAAVLLAKGIGAVVVLALTAVVVPLIASIVIASQAYGALPDLAAVATFAVLLVAVAASFVALDLALATVLDSQAAIAAIAFAVFAAPFVLGGLLPSAATWWPTSIGAFASDIAFGEPMPIGTLVGWAGGLLIAGIAGTLILQRKDI